MTEPGLNKVHPRRRRRKRRKLQETVSPSAPSAAPPNLSQAFQRLKALNAKHQGTPYMGATWKGGHAL